jgi:hypothetical protein
MGMAKTKTAAAAQIPQPTFAQCNMDCWDDETNMPDTASPYDLEDYEVMAIVKADIAAFSKWRDIQDDKAEAPARQAYAEHVASYLVGVFPGARVNTKAYAAAAGEDLAGFSADIVKLVAQRARRTLKTLPSIAQLYEMATIEQSRRMRQWNAYKEALKAHTFAIAKSKVDADRVAEKVAAAGLPSVIDAAAILRLCDIITLYPFIATSCSSPRGRLWRAILQRLERGDAAVAALATDLLGVDQRHRSLSADAEARGEDDASWSERYSEWDRESDAILTLLAEAVGLTWQGFYS